MGVIITSDLKWNEHITYIYNKAMKKLGFLRRSLGNATPELKILAYKTFIRPILEYASIVWDPHTQTNITKVEKVQRKSARFIFNTYSWRMSPSTLLKTAELENLATRRYRDRMKFFYLLYNGQLGIDKALYILPASHRCTRSYHNKKVKDFSCRTSAFKNSFFPRTVSEWNALTASIVDCQTVSSFLSALANNS